MRHMYYGDRKTLDLQKMRDEAQYRLDKEGIETTIHHHQYLGACVTHEHDVYKKEEDNDKDS